MRPDFEAEVVTTAATVGHAQLRADGPTSVTSEVFVSAEVLKTSALTVMCEDAAEAIPVQVLDGRVNPWRRLKSTNSAGHFLIVPMRPARTSAIACKNRCPDSVLCIVPT